MKKIIKGVIAAVITPVNFEGKIMHNNMRELCDFLIDKSLDGLFILGSTGFGPLFTVDERKKITKTVVEHVDKRLPVIVNVGSPSTRITIELAKHSQSVGVDAVGIYSPYYYYHSENAIEEYFDKVAEEVPELPIFLYLRNPKYGNSISQNIVKNLTSKHKNIVGVKDSTGSHCTIPDYKNHTPDNTIFLQGVETLVLNSLVMGADGIISGLATALPEIVQEVNKNFVNGDLTQAKKSQYFLNKVHEFICAGKPYANIMKILEWRGYPIGQPPLPFMHLTSEEEDQLRDFLKKENLL